VSAGEDIHDLRPGLRPAFRIGMRAVQLVGIDQPVVAVTLPDPQPAAGEVRVRIAACGICHSDAHYRGGVGRVDFPRTPGHEVSGIVDTLGSGVTGVDVGDRVALHYLVTCGVCDRCRGAGEQFCRQGEMLGKDRDGGYAEAITVPARNAIAVPDSVDLAHAAVMMCSTSTAYHALRLAEIAGGETVAILGFGGLGVSALQLARALGAVRIAAIDVVPEKLALAERWGATALDASRADFGAELDRFAGARGIDLALDFAGRPTTSVAVLQRLAPRGRLVLVALSREALPFDPYRDLVGREARVLGCSDHLRSELVELFDLARAGRFDPSLAVSATVPLAAAPIDAALHALERGTPLLRTVIVP
jgi:propanol-preferring alcohol dehydrogenase